MSEITLLPCPACHECEDLTVLRAATDDDLHVKQISCPCGTFGPYRYTVKEAIEAWNSLPRHLTWTTEPPKVAGLFLRRWKFGDHWDKPDMMNIEPRNIGKIREREDQQWCHIPMPKEKQ